MLYERKERRAKKDLILQVIGYLVIACWFIMAGAFLLLGKAKPQPRSPQELLYEESIPGNLKPLDYTYINMLFYVMIAGFAISVFGLLLNSKRMKRKGDHYRLTFVFVMILSLIGMVMWYLRY